MAMNPVIFVVISAFLYGLSQPLAKLLLNDITPVAMAGLLYAGSFAGLSLFSLIPGTTGSKKYVPVSRKDLPYLAGSVISGGILAPICMMLGLSYVSGFTASLFGNLEAVATALIAYLFFKENTGKRLWIALTLMTAAVILLAWDPGQGKFAVTGPIFLLLGMICWGIDNNVTCVISDKDPIFIARVKSIVSGLISITIAVVVLGAKIRPDIMLVYALTLGAFSYGASLVFFIKSLEKLGSARTGALFSVAPFVGAIGSLIILKDWPGWTMFPAAGLMAGGAWLILNESHSHFHCHESVTHVHQHNHDDLHHTHCHDELAPEPHAHEHTHPDENHEHAHTPDSHHRHGHD